MKQVKWTKDCGKEPCDVCYEDWEQYQEWEAYVGTILVQTCGDGCCHERVGCDWCYGTGIKTYES